MPNLRSAANSGNAPKLEESSTGPRRALKRDQLHQFVSSGAQTRAGAKRKAEEEAMRPPARAKPSRRTVAMQKAPTQLEPAGGGRLRNRRSEPVLRMTDRNQSKASIGLMATNRSETAKGNIPRRRGGVPMLFSDSYGRATIAFMGGGDRPAPHGEQILRATRELPSSPRSEPRFPRTPVQPRPDVGEELRHQLDAKMRNGAFKNPPPDLVRTGITRGFLMKMERVVEASHVGDEGKTIVKQLEEALIYLFIESGGSNNPSQPDQCVQYFKNHPNDLRTRLRYLREELGVYQDDSPHGVISLKNPSPWLTCQEAENDTSPNALIGVPVLLTRPNSWPKVMSVHQDLRRKNGLPAVAAQRLDYPRCLSSSLTQRPAAPDTRQANTTSNILSHAQALGFIPQGSRRKSFQQPESDDSLRFNLRSPVAIHKNTLVEASDSPLMNTTGNDATPDAPNRAQNSSPIPGSNLPTTEVRMPQVEKAPTVSRLTPEDLPPRSVDITVPPKPTNIPVPPAIIELSSRESTAPVEGTKVRPIYIDSDSESTPAPESSACKIREASVVQVPTPPDSLKNTPEGIEEPGIEDVMNVHDRMRERLGSVTPETPIGEDDEQISPSLVPPKYTSKRKRYNPIRDILYAPSYQVVRNKWRNPDPPDIPSEERLEQLERVEQEIEEESSRLHAEHEKADQEFDGNIRSLGKRSWKEKGRLREAKKAASEVYSAICGEFSQRLLCVKEERSRLEEAMNIKKEVEPEEAPDEPVHVLEQIRRSPVCGFLAMLYPDDESGSQRVDDFVALAKWVPPPEESTYPPRKRKKPIRKKMKW